jgi:L-ascorbate metabolism protein UlaG (beta-lactamase superfamily)
MQISYLGVSCFKIRAGGTTLLADPFLPSFVGLHLPKQEADIVTISHDHQDHNDLSRLKNSPFVIKAPGEYEIKGISVFGYPAFHDKERKIPNNIFIVEAEGIRIGHLGDLGVVLDQKELEMLDGVDVLLIKVGDKRANRLSVKETVKLIAQIEPYIVIPMHFRVPQMDPVNWSNIATLEDFTDEYGSEGEKMEKLVVTRADLKGEETKLVILERKE